MSIPANDEIVFGLNMEELRAIADKMNGKHQVRFNPDDTWTAEKELDLKDRMNARLSELKAEIALMNADPSSMLQKPL